MSCAYDSIGWGAHFSAAASPQQQWQTYFTADFVCETAAGCTCHTTWVRMCLQAHLLHTAPPVYAACLTLYLPPAGAASGSCACAAAGGTCDRPEHASRSSDSCVCHAASSITSSKPPLPSVGPDISGSDLRGPFASNLCVLPITPGIICCAARNFCHCARHSNKPRAWPQRTDTS